MMKNQTVTAARAQLLQIYSKALNSVQGQICVRDFLAKTALPSDKVHAVAVGKAAASMMQGALDSLGSRLEKGLVITKYRHGLPMPARVHVMLSAHPVADENSLVAGQALIEFVQACEQPTTLLCLMSGGTSALAEVLPATLGIEQLRDVNEWMLSQPFTIHQINALRKLMSLIKGGGLLNYLNTANCWQLTLSDVPGNDLGVVGSGLLVQDKPASLSNIELPRRIREILLPQKNENAPGAVHIKDVHQVVLADNQTLRDSVADIANTLALPVQRNTVMQGDAQDFAEHAVQLLREGERGVYIWGGETVLQLPPQQGIGGRCQHIALCAAMALAGVDNSIVLAVATDGTDGPGDVAGAMIDGQTITRGLDAGFDAATCLLAADSGSYLQASGDLIDTGPTGSNVNDMVIGLKW